MLLKPLVVLVPVVLVAACGGDGDTDTDAGTDTTPPTVISTTPEADAVDVPIDTTITVTFSEDMSSGSFDGNIGFGDTNGDVSHSMSVSGAVLTITPDADLTGNLDHNLEIQGNVQDLAGNAMGAPYGLHFATGTSDGGGGGEELTVDLGSLQVSTANGETEQFYFTAAAAGVHFVAVHATTGNVGLFVCSAEPCNSTGADLASESDATPEKTVSISATAATTYYVGVEAMGAADYFIAVVSQDGTGAAFELSIQINAIFNTSPNATKITFTVSSGSNLYNAPPFDVTIWSNRTSEPDYAAATSGTASHSFTSLGRNASETVTTAGPSGTWTSGVQYDAYVIVDFDKDVPELTDANNVGHKQWMARKALTVGTPLEVIGHPGLVGNTRYYGFESASAGLHTAFVYERNAAGRAASWNCSIGGPGSQMGGGMGSWMACKTDTATVSPINPGIFEIALWHDDDIDPANYWIVVVEGDGVSGSDASPTELNVGAGAAGDTDLSFVVQNVFGGVDNYFEFVAAGAGTYSINLAYTDLDITPTLFSSANFTDNQVALTPTGCQPSCTTNMDLVALTTYYLKLSGSGSAAEAYGDVTITISPP